jgi:uroporphyrinogen-III synthase
MTARVALFRAREDATASAARLRRLGFSVACLPAIEIKAQAVRPSRSRYDAVVATSGKAFLGDGKAEPSQPRRARHRVLAGAKQRDPGGHIASLSVCAAL